MHTLIITAQPRESGQFLLFRPITMVTVNQGNFGTFSILDACSFYVAQLEANIMIDEEYGVSKPGVEAVRKKSHGKYLTGLKHIPIVQLFN